MDPLTKEAVRHSDTDFIHRLIGIISKAESDGDTLLELLDLAKEITAYENGFISFLDEEYYELILSSTFKNQNYKEDSFRLCTKLCQEILEKGETVYHSTLKDNPNYKLIGQVFIGAESIIGVPIFVKGVLYGTFTLYSTSEHSACFYDEHHVNIDLIVSFISRIIYDVEVKRNLQLSESLLTLGEEFLQMAVYKRFSKKDLLESTEGFRKLFDLDESYKEKPIQKVLSKIVPEDREKVINLTKVKTSGTAEYRITTGDNNIKWLRHRARVSEDGVYMLGVIQDITEDKKTALKLEIQNTELEQFAYASAHDLQEPLRTITGFITVLSQKLKGKLDQEEREYIHYIINASTRMQDQIDGILENASIGRQNDRTNINLNTLVKNVVDDLSASISLKNVDIIVEELPSILAYEIELRMLLLNLINNAIKFSQEGRAPIIKISSSDEGMYWKIIVEDNGIGIKDAQIPKIFRLFSRLHPKGIYEGTGIGLTQVKKIVELHEGDIKVESVVGVGSKFIFTIKK